MLLRNFEFGRKKRSLYRPQMTVQLPRTDCLFFKTETATYQTELKDREHFRTRRIYVCFA